MSTLTLRKLCIDVNIWSWREALEDHDCRNEEEFLADVEHVLGRASRDEVKDVLDCRHVAFAAVDLK